MPSLLSVVTSVTGDGPPTPYVKADQPGVHHEKATCDRPPRGLFPAAPLVVRPHRRIADPGTGDAARVGGAPPLSAASQRSPLARHGFNPQPSRSAAGS